MSEVTARVATIVDASRKKVWDALTDPEAIRQYFMGATVSTDWKVGSPITFAGEWKGEKYEDKGEILTFRPEAELKFSHWSPMSGSADSPENYHVVDITLDATEGGTEVVLTQSNLEGGITDADRASRADYERNWTSTLAGLKTVVEA
jgi:uncharacterized protein YndB with AHSA1/START domain